MRWDDTGYLLSKNKYNENSVIAEFYTLDHGKCSGLIYGGTSRKIKNYLQLGNKVFISFKSKNENKNGYFTIEIIEAISPLFFDNREKMSVIVSCINLLHILTPELQKNEKVFKLLSNLFNNLKSSDENTIINYIFWELDLLKELGYDLNLHNSSQILNNNDFIEIFLDNEKFKIPFFLTQRNYEKINKKSIFSALVFIGEYLSNKILKPNNIIYPKNRMNLQNLYK